MFQDVTAAPAFMLMVSRWTSAGGLRPRRRSRFICFVFRFPIPASGDFDFARTGPDIEQLRNNGNGTFTEWTAQSGLAGDAPGIAAIARL
jgi:hypothetical protein